MKGWRPSAIPKARNRFGPVAGEFYAGHRIDRPVFIREVSVPGDPWIVGFPFRAHRLRGRRVGQIRLSVRDHEKAPALHSGGTENEDRRTDEQRGGEPRDAHFATAFAAGIGLKKKKCLGGQRKSLKRLNSAKELRHFNLDFVPPDLEFVPSGLDFVPKNLDFLHSARLTPPVRCPNRDSPSNSRANSWA